MNIHKTLPSRRRRYLTEWFGLLVGLLILGAYIGQTQYQDYTGTEFAAWGRESRIQNTMFGMLALISILTLFFYQRRQRAFELLFNTQEQTLQTSEARLKSFFDATPDVQLISDAQGMIIMANLQTHNLLGYATDELIGQSIEILVPDRSRANHPSLRAMFALSPLSRRMGQGLAVSARRKDGKEVEVEISLGRFETAQGLYFACGLREITERKQADKSLRESEQRFRALTEMSSDFYWETDVEHRITARTESKREICEEVFRQNSIIGKRRWEISYVAPDETGWQKHRAILDEHLPFRDFEISRIRANSDLHHISLSGDPIFDDLGNFAGYRGVGADITERLQTLTALRESEAFAHSILNSVSASVAVMDRRGAILSANEPWRRFALENGLEPGKPALQSEVGSNYFAVCGASPDPSSQDALDTGRGLQGVLDGNLLSFSLEYACHSTTQQRWFVMNAQPLGQDAKYGVVITHTDVTQVRQDGEQLRIAAAAFESLEGMIVTDADGAILRVNRAFTESTGYTEADIVGKNPRLLQSGRHDKDFFRAMWETLSRTGSWQGEIWDRRKNGEVYPKWLSISAVMDRDGAVTHYVSTHADISVRKQAEDKIHELAFFDQLTGLPNRTLLLDRLKQAITTSDRIGNFGALLLIDLDNFKSINDTLGHDVGDLLLKQVSKRLTQCVREGDTLARLGGDEFVVVLGNLGMSEKDAAIGTETAGEKILATLNQIYRFSDVAYHSSASIGATLFNGQPISIDNLMKQADLTMYKAKEAGRNTLRFFDPAMELAVKVRAALESDLRAAIEAKRFVLHYQAQVAGGQVTGAEVLVRWKHVERGMVSPAEFIPLAEETGLILTLGHWVLETACTQLAVWATQPSRAHFTLAVNVSAVQFNQADFVDQVLSVLGSTGANPYRLKLELTESILAHNVQDIIEKMFALKARGVGFSLDDFGTGYSSLSYLKRLPLDQLKIDQSFVRDVMVDANDAAIVKAVVALAKSLGLGVIAEGVETKAQKDYLASFGCHAYQGYFFSKPLAVEAFESFAQELVCPA